MHIFILDGRLGKRSVERVRYVINNLLHLVIVKYGDISLVLCISTRLRLVTILSLLVNILSYHADPCNKSYIFFIFYSTYVTFDLSEGILSDSYNASRRWSINLNLLPERFKV